MSRKLHDWDSKKGDKLRKMISDLDDAVKHVGYEIEEMSYEGAMLRIKIGEHVDDMALTLGDFMGAISEACRGLYPKPDLIYAHGERHIYVSLNPKARQDIRNYTARFLQAYADVLARKEGINLNSTPQ